MIGRTSIGKGFMGNLIYLLDRKNKPEILMSNGIYGEKPGILARMFSAVSNDNLKVKNVVWHTSLSFDDNDHITHEKMIGAAERFLEKAGFSKDNNQYIIIGHNGTAHNHVHICANRVGFDGTCVDDSYCKSRTVQWSKEIEIEMNLIRVVDKRNENTIIRDRVPVIEKAKKRIQLWTDLYLSREGRITFEGMMEYLKKQDIEMKVHAHINTGLAYGVSFKVGVVAVKGSKIGKKYSFKALYERINGFSTQPYL